MIRQLLFPLLAVLNLWVSLNIYADEAKPAAENPALTMANQLYRAGKFGEAGEKFQAILREDSKLVAAEVGLIRCLLRQQKIDEAFSTATTALAVQPNSAPLNAVMGDVEFRRGQMTEAEVSYRKALTTDPKQVEAYLGLVRLYRAYSLYGRAYDALKRAHELAPEQPEVQRLWFSHLSRRERIAALDAYLAGPHPDDVEQTASMREYLAFLKVTADKPVHACRLVSKVDQTDTKLELLRTDPQHVFGIGLVVKLNGHDARLQLDTGASGIVIGHKIAEKAGMQRISEETYAGIGDKGSLTGYAAVAEHIRVGNLEFQDCLVHVSDRVSVTNEDGLIGADVFSSYLIDIDTPDQKLRLSPLPKRPNEPAAPATLSTEEDSQAASEEKTDSAHDQNTQTEGDAQKPSITASAEHLPQDRYVAPEMGKWTPVFRFGHALLIRTHVNESPAMLFMIDTGANINALSLKAATQVTKISADPYSEVKGLNGSVSKVYRANKGTIIFAHMAQKNQDIVTFDLSTMSRHFGTEVSGILGFETLHMLQVKIDYRDGLVDFVYDEKRWGSGK